MRHDPDRELLTRWRDGDATAAQLLVDRYTPLLLRFFGARAETVAFDLIQDTFLILAKRTQSTTQIASFRSYLLGIAHKQLLMWYRRDARDRRDLKSEIEAWEPPTGTSPSQDVARSEREIAVRNAIRGLPNPARITIQLFYWEAWSLQEIAEATAVSVGTVKSRLARTRALLAETLGIALPDNGPDFKS